MTKKKILIRDCSILFVFAIIICAIHFAIIYFFSELFPTKTILFSHLLLMGLTIIAAILLNFIFKKIKANLFAMAFMAVSFIKMLLSLSFLFPFIRSDMPDKINFVSQFFVVYFIYLIWEIIIVRNQIKTK